jgi:excisionase family DNA binding protein
MDESAGFDDAVGFSAVAGAAAGRELSTREVADWLDVSERSVRRAIASGELAAHRQGRGFRVTLESCKRYREGRLAAVRAVPMEPSPGPRLLRLPAPPAKPAPPLSRTSLVGRADELATVCAHLLAELPPPLTLTGPGGVGKTRLALAAGHALAQDFDDGVAFVDLAPLRDPGSVAAAIEQVLGVREAGDRPLEARIIAHLRHRHMLLILDNFEHLLPAAPLVGLLVAACPHLAVLATSRAPLRIRGERVLSVPPLAVVSAGRQVGRPDAVQLFVERAQAARADFALTEANAGTVDEICQRLDGLPLAIELAAARCATLSPQTLLARFALRLPLLATGPRDLALRHQSLHETIGWSYALLPAAEQAAFRALSVFAGGFTLPAAEELLSRGETAASSALDLVAALHAQSLLVRSEGTAGAPRFGMLETVREFAWEQLREQGEEAAAQRWHAEYYLRLVEDAAVRMPLTNGWWGLYEAEWGNLRSALDWSVKSENAPHTGGETAVGLRFGWALFGYWALRGQVGEGITWLEQALAAGKNEPPVARGRAMMALGFLTWYAGDLERTERLTSAALEVFEREGDTIAAGVCCLQQGYLAESRGDLAGAVAHLEYAQARYASAGYAEGVAAAGAHLGRVLGRLGDRERGRAVLTEAVAVLDRPQGGLWGAAIAYGDLGVLVAADGDVTQAAELVARGLGLHAAIGDELTVVVSLAAAAEVVAAAGQATAAAHLLGAAATLRERAGSSLWAVAGPRADRAAALTRLALGESAFGLAWAAGSRWATGEAIAAARSALELVADGTTTATAGTREDAGVLSPRELAVLKLVVQGQTDQEIAWSFGLRVSTVRSHMGNVRRKLGVVSRAAATAEYIRRGFL